MKFLRFSGFLVYLTVSSAAATVVVDQEYVGPNNKTYALDYPGDYMAQTFKVQNSGQIISVGLQLSMHDHFRRPNYMDVTDNLHFKLTRTNLVGEPIVDDVLATYEIARQGLTYDNSGLPMLEIDLRNQHVQVRAGDVLALVLTSNYTYFSHSLDQNYFWNTSFYNVTPDGHFYLYSPKVFGEYWFYKWFLNDPTESWDAGYRITIDAVPEPTTALLATLTAMVSIAFGQRMRIGPVELSRTMRRRPRSSVD